MADVSMPRLSDSMEEGTIVRWLKSDGDEVRRGEEIVEIETDKANMTYEADDDGVLSIVAGEGDTLPVGELIARIGEGGADGGGGNGSAEAAGGEGAATAEGDDATAAAADGDGAGTEEGDGVAADGDGEGTAEADDATAAVADGDGAATEEADDAEAATDGEATAEADDEKAAAADGDGAPTAEGDDATAAARDGAPRKAGPRETDGGKDGGQERIKASPVARRLAREAGVALDAITGSGPGGRIVKADVEAAAERPEPEPEPEPAKAPAPAAAGTAKGETTVQELSRLQQVVARRMAESKATAPDFHLTVEVDMEAAVELRKQLKAADPQAVTPSFNDFVVKAAALALRDVPRANGAYRDGRFELYSRVNVGIAVAGADALVVATIFDADRKSLGEIAREARTLAERVRANEITPPELSGGTFTVSNLGMYGIRRFVAVINPPQAAILSVGALEPRAVVRDGEVVARATMEMTLACDHRILYGAEAAQFLGRIRERLEQPLMLAL